MIPKQNLAIPRHTHLRFARLVTRLQPCMHFTCACTASVQTEEGNWKASADCRRLSQFPKARLLRSSFKHSTPRPSLCLSKRPMGGKEGEDENRCRCTRALSVTSDALSHSSNDPSFPSSFPRHSRCRKIPSAFLTTLLRILHLFS